MLIDMHTHTSRYSLCSMLDPAHLVYQAANMGISGVVITEHNYVWSNREIEVLKKEIGTNMVILQGQEVNSSDGHLLVFGYHGNLEGRSAQAIIKKVHKKGGAVVLAHPFRYGRYLDEQADDLMDLFAPFDAVEILNGNQNQMENDYAKDIHERLGITGIGGSDAHSSQMVGRYLTWFETAIKDEGDLIQAIKNGKCKPVAYTYEYNRKSALR